MTGRPPWQVAAELPCATGAMACRDSNGWCGSARARAWAGRHGVAEEPQGRPAQRRCGAWWWRRGEKRWVVGVSLLNPTDVVACTNLKHEELQSSPSERYIRFPEALTQFELGSKKRPAIAKCKMLTGDGVVGIGEGKGSPNPQIQADPTTPLRLLGARPIGPCDCLAQRRKPRRLAHSPAVPPDLPRARRHPPPQGPAGPRPARWWPVPTCARPASSAAAWPGRGEQNLIRSSQQGA
jgi:hypothetical protein